jgi:hypothetical protein
VREAASSVSRSFPLWRRGFRCDGLRDRPDAARYDEEIAGHEMAARALTDPAMCEDDDS